MQYMERNSEGVCVFRDEATEQAIRERKEFALSESVEQLRESATNEVDEELAEELYILIQYIRLHYITVLRSIYEYVAYLYGQVKFLNIREEDAKQPRRSEPASTSDLYLNYLHSDDPVTFRVLFFKVLKLFTTLQSSCLLVFLVEGQLDRCPVSRSRSLHARSPG